MFYPFAFTAHNIHTHTHKMRLTIYTRSRASKTHAHHLKAQCPLAPVSLRSQSPNHAYAIYHTLAQRQRRGGVRTSCLCVCVCSMRKHLTSRQRLPSAHSLSLSLCSAYALRTLTQTRSVSHLLLVVCRQRSTTSNIHDPHHKPTSIPPQHT